MCFNHSVPLKRKYGFGVRFSKEEKTWIRRVAVMRGCLYTFSKGDLMKWVLEAKIYSHQNGDEFFHCSDDLTVQAQTLVWYIGVISSHAQAMARLL